MNPDEPKRFQHLERVLKIIWSAMLLSIAVYGAAVYFVTVKADPRPSPQNLALVETVLSIAGVVMMGGSFLVSRVLASPERIARCAEGNPQKAAQLVQGGYVGAWALAESVAIFGLVIAFLQHEFWKFPPYALAAIVLFVLQFPNTARYERAFND